MKAIQITQTGSPDVLQYVDVETPSPELGQALVKIESISMNFADVMTRKGMYPDMPPLPIIPGIECSGVVEEVGEGLTHIKAGQKVAIFGKPCYADYVLGDAASLIPLPDEVDMDAAAAFPVIYLTAYHMLHTMARVKAGETVLLYAAAGGVGMAVTQLAKIAGVKVIGLTSSEEKMSFAKSQGIDHIINYKTEDVVDRVNEITAGKGVNVIFDSVAGEGFPRNFKMLAPLGQIIMLGMAGGPPQGDLMELLTTNFGRSAGIRLFVLYSVPELDPALMSDSIQTVLNYLSKGKIKPHIHDRIPLAEAARAHTLMESQMAMGKLILKP